MKAMLRSRRRLPVVIAVIALILLGVGLSRIPSAQALHQGGGSSKSGGCKNGVNICTDNGFGWTLYSTNGSDGKPDYFKVDSWATVSSTCALPGGGGGVYIFEVAGKAKPGTNTPYTEAYPMNIAWNTSIPASPGSSYWNRHYSGDDYNTVHNDYLNNLGGSPNRWTGDSHSLEWFCYENYNFNLTPSIVTNPDKSVIAGSTIAATGTVTNAGPTPSSNVNWQITQFTVAPNGTVPAGGDSPQAPVAFYKNGATVIGSGSGTFGLSPTPLAPVNSTIPDLPVGTKVCYTLSVNPYSQSSGNWRHSTPYCVVISNKPLVQIWGGDLRVGAAFVGNTAPTSSAVQTSLLVKAGTTYGSWDEYGIAASGAVTGTASGSALAGGLACVGSTCKTNNLTFANSGSIGNYVSSNTIPDVASSFPISTTTAPLTPQFVSLADTALQRVETSSNDITIGGGTILKGQWLVINAPKATVTITGDINYDPSPLTGINDIPQLVIIANQINIDGGVKNVDAWLIASGATGSINTCDDVPVTAQLTASVCNNQLTVNGPVMAKHLYLRRTYTSSGTSLGDPAEIFNLRPDAYLWATYQASKSALLETTYSEELPPRF